MSRIISRINQEINDLQSMASQLADCDHDGDRTLEEALKAFLVSACIGMLDKATMMRADRERMLQYILDQTILGEAVLYNAKEIYQKLQQPSTDAYQTLYGLANGWDMPGNEVGWQIYTVMSAYFDRLDITEAFVPEVEELLHDIGVLLDEKFQHVPVNRAYYLYVKESLERLNQVLREQLGMEEDLFTVEMGYDEEPSDIEPQVESIRDPFGFADEN